MAAASRFGLILCLLGTRLLYADTPGVNPAAGGAPGPQQNFMSSLKQAFQQDFDHQVVRGHFDVGSPPDVVHRYYCLVDAKTGKRQVNGVAGEPAPRPDGMTGIKGTAVSLYTCAGAEQQGLLVTTGYSLIGGAAAGAAAPREAPPAVVVTHAKQPAYHVDVAGVSLGMSLDEVRGILRAKKLLDYRESTQDLHAGATSPFVNMIAAWTPLVDGDGESYEIMFTPVPGGERAMAIIHSVSYSPAHAVRETALTGGLVRKYDGFEAADRLPATPTWRVQSDGIVQVGDSCKRRGLFGGLADIGAAGASRPNLALKTTPEEFRYQIDMCGEALVTEDHVAASAGLASDERSVSRFTVTAYSPSLAFEGATVAAQMMQTATKRGAVNKADPTQSKDHGAPNL